MRNKVRRSRKLLRRIPEFAALDSTDTLRLSYNCYIKTFSRNDVLITQGCLSETLVAVLEGTCNVSRKISVREGPGFLPHPQQEGVDYQCVQSAEVSNMMEETKVATDAKRRADVYKTPSMQERQGLDRSQSRLAYMVGTSSQRNQGQKKMDQMDMKIDLSTSTGMALFGSISSGAAPATITVRVLSDTLHALVIRREVLKDLSIAAFSHLRTSKKVHENQYNKRVEDYIRSFVRRSQRLGHEPSGRVGSTSKLNSEANADGPTTLSSRHPTPVPSYDYKLGTKDSNGSRTQLMRAASAGSLRDAPGQYKNDFPHQTDAGTRSRSRTTQRPATAQRTTHVSLDGRQRLDFSSTRRAGEDPAPLDEAREEAIMEEVSQALARYTVKGEIKLRRRSRPSSSHHSRPSSGLRVTGLRPGSAASIPYQPGSVSPKGSPIMSVSVSSKKFRPRTAPLSRHQSEPNLIYRSQRPQSGHRGSRPMALKKLKPMAMAQRTAGSIDIARSERLPFRQYRTDNALPQKEELSAETVSPDGTSTTTTTLTATSTTANGTTTTTATTSTSTATSAATAIPTISVGSETAPTMTIDIESNSSSSSAPATGNSTPEKHHPVGQSKPPAPNDVIPEHREDAFDHSMRDPFSSVRIRVATGDPSSAPNSEEYTRLLSSPYRQMQIRDQKLFLRRSRGESMV